MTINYTNLVQENEFQILEIITELRKETNSFISFIAPVDRIQYIKNILTSHSESSYTHLFEHYFNQVIQKSGILEFQIPIVKNEKYNNTYPIDLLHNYIILPIIKEENVIFLLGVGNKVDSYEKIDLQKVQLYSTRLHHIFEKKQNPQKSNSIIKDEHLFQAQKSAHIGLWEYDHTTKSYFWSKEIFRIFEIIGKYENTTLELIESRISQDHFQEVTELHKIAISEGIPFEIEYTINLPNFTTKTIHEKSETIMDKDGNPSRTESVIQDTSGVKLIELNLKRSEWNLNSIVECSPYAILIIKQSSIVFANNASIQLFKTTRENITSLKINELIQLEEVENFEYVINKFENQEFGDIGDFVEYRMKKTIFPNTWMGFWGIEIFYNSESAFLLYVIDITKRKETEMQLLQSEKMATIGVLAAGVAHEINNPIAFILSNLRSLQKYTDILKQSAVNVFNILNKPDVLARHSEVNEIDKEEIFFILDDLNDLIEESIDGSKKVADIVSDIKSFTYQDRDEIELADINQIIQSTLNLLKNKLKYDTTVHLQLSNDLPRLKCNSRQIGQIMMNLLINSHQAIQDKKLKVNSPLFDIGKIHIQTELEEINEKTFLCITVRDNGIGIPKENIQKVFDPFFTTKDIGVGTGLGLSIVFDILKKHSGTIKIESSINVGTELKIYLPLHQDIEGESKEHGTESVHK